MAGFDPDKYLQASEPASFDPDAYLAGPVAPKAPPIASKTEVSASGLGKSFRDALPMIGGTIGGALGMLSPVPGGSMIGAGGGYALGKAGQDLVDQYILDKPKEAIGIPSKIAETAGNMATGAALQGAGELAGHAVKAASSATPITQAATTIGKPVTDFLAGLIPSRTIDKVVSKAGNAIIDSNAPLHADKAFQTVAGIAAKTFERLPQSYQAILFKANEESPKKAAITHFLMSSQDPAYQDALNADQPK